MTRREGPSPRVREADAGADGGALAGSIPACAGKPGRQTLGDRERRRLTVHPRVCGEARADRAGFAGGRRGVHPRVCGEAFPSPPPLAPGRGPSPRVRGSRMQPDPQGRAPRSIPACAGKPEARPHPDCFQWVHPRVCGEAADSEIHGGVFEGPSPRVRGSPTAAVNPPDPAGSIPACAGKPRLEAGAGVVHQVHPRVCGEALCRDVPKPPAPGPSPRVRGSLMKTYHVAVRMGSIPACAGKPGA